MRKEAPRGLKTLSEAGNRTDFSRNGNTFRKQVENIDENHKEKERENPVLLVEPIPNWDGKVNLGNSEVEYIESENLKDVEDVGLSMKVLSSEDFISFLCCLGCFYQLNKSILDVLYR